MPRPAILIIALVLSQIFFSVSPLQAQDEVRMNPLNRQPGVPPASYYPGSLNIPVTEGINKITPSPEPGIMPAPQKTESAPPPLSRLEKIYKRYYQDIGGVGMEEKDPRMGLLQEEERDKLSVKDLMQQAGDVWRSGRYDKDEYDAALDRLKFEQQWRETHGRLMEEEKTRGTGHPGGIPEKPGFAEVKERGEVEGGEEILRQFGYDLFQVEREPLVETQAIPDNEYIVGPEDQLLIRAWGAGIDFSVTCPVSNDGTISIPKMGVISVAGLKSGEIEKAINSEAQKYVPGVNLRVTLDGLRTLEIYFAGNVAQPGLHILPAFSTIVGALIKGGGPTKDGSLRNIKLIRNKKVIAVMDMYDVLLHGNRSNDAYLQSGDLIFVPNIGKTVAITGLVAKNGIFELKDEKTWHKVLALGGGLLPQANNGRLTLKRFSDNQVYLLKQLSLNDSVLNEETTVRNGDYLMAEPVLPLQKAIKVSGHVFEPRLVEFTQGLVLSDVLQSPELLKPGAIMTDALIRRYNVKTGYYETIHFPLRQVFEKKYDLPLAEYDEIIILAKKDYDIEESVHISGAVWKPGSYPYNPGMKLGSLVVMAGGLKKGAVLDSVELNRQEIVKNRLVTEREVLDWEKQRSTGHDIVLREGDFVLIKEVNHVGRVAMATIDGEVAFPGVYAVKRGDRLSDLLRRAGGYLEDAYLYGVKFTRETAKKIKKERYARLIADLELEIGRSSSKATMEAMSPQDVAAAQAVLKAQNQFLDNLKKIKIDGRIVIKLANLATFTGSKYDFVLEDGDRIVIPKKPDFVTVLGSVYSANSYLFDPQLNIGDYLRKAGGATPEADMKRMYVIKANGDVISRKDAGGIFLVSSFEHAELMPGDTLVVPEKFDRVPWLKTVRDIADLVFKMATTAGVAIAALP